MFPQHLTLDPDRLPSLDPGTYSEDKDYFM